MKKLLLGAVSAAALLFTANAASANCDDGEMVIKFSHVVAATGHPKGDAATLLLRLRCRNSKPTPSSIACSTCRSCLLA